MASRESGASEVLSNVEAILDLMPVAAYTCDAAGLVTAFNQRAEALWGRRPRLGVDRWCGSTRLMSQDGREIPHDRCCMARAISERRPCESCEVVFERGDGTHRTVLAHANPIMSADGRVLGALNVLVDITARKEAERAVGEAQAETERLESLLLVTSLARAADATEASRALNESLARTTGLARSAVLIFGNDGVCRFTGWRGLSDEYRRQIDGHCPWRLGERSARPIVVADVQSQKSLMAYRDLFQRESIRSLAFIPVLTEDGVVGKLMLYSDVAGGISPAQVMSAQSAAASLGVAVSRLLDRERLEQSERRTRAIIEGADVVAWEFECSERRFTYLSPQATKFGYSWNEMTSPGFWEEQIHPDDRTDVMRQCEIEVRAGRSHRVQYRFRRRNGEYVWLDHFGAVEQRADGVPRLRGVFIDVTESRRLRDSAEAANRAKSEFLANMSHEIRTPLTAILGYADLLVEDGDLAKAPQRRQETLATICRAGEHLLTVVNDILDLSKIEAGRVEIEEAETDFPGLLLGVESLMRARAANKGVGLKVRLATPVPEKIMADPTRLRQILLNLVGNAVKFTDTGAAEIVATVSENGTRLTIDVEDTGPGMTEEQVKRLFRPFTQADASVTRRYGGTGLGLTICRRLAELMGGSVTLERSGPGQGSCFRFSMSLRPAPNTAWTDSVRSVRTGHRTGEPVASLSGRVLLVEDGVDNQRLFAFHLVKAGLEVEIAENGLRALEAIHEGQRTGRVHDLLLTDVQMPVMDGYTLVRTLRSEGNTIPIIALTAHAMAEDRERCLSAGCDDYVTKPVEKSQLLEVCARWLRRRSEARSGRTAA